MSIQSSTADSKNLSGHNSMSASLNTIRCLGEEQIYSYGWRAVTFLCGVVVREVPDGDPAVGRRAPAGGHPQVPLRQHPRRRHRPLLRRHLPLPLLLLLPPCTTHEDTRKSGRNQITAESSGIKSEGAARAPDDPGGAGLGRTCGDRRRRGGDGGGGGRRGSHPGRGVSAARRVAKGDQASQVERSARVSASEPGRRGVRARPIR